MRSWNSPAAPGDGARLQATAGQAETDSPEDWEVKGPCLGANADQRLYGEFQLCSKSMQFFSMEVRHGENYHVWSDTCEENKQTVGGCDVPKAAAYHS